jgi:hypothetical protein
VRTSPFKGNFFLILVEYAAFCLKDTSKPNGMPQPLFLDENAAALIVYALRSSSRSAGVVERASAKRERVKLPAASLGAAAAAPISSMDAKQGTFRSVSAQRDLDLSDALLVVVVANQF